MVRWMVACLRALAPSGWVRYYFREMWTSTHSKRMRALEEYIDSVGKPGKSVLVRPFLRDMHVRGWTPQLLEQAIADLIDLREQDGSKPPEPFEALHALARTTGGYTGDYSAEQVLWWLRHDRAARTAAIRGVEDRGAGAWFWFALLPHVRKGLSLEEAYLAYRARIDADSYLWGPPSSETLEGWRMLAGLLPEPEWDLSRNRLVVPDTAA